jgi:flagellar basal-body rod protein FlgG
VNGAFYIGAAGLAAEERALAVIANNVTNVNTTGFKRSQAVFSALVSASDNNGATPLVDDDPTAGLSGVVVGSTPVDFSEGPLQQTGKPLDLAIDGTGFLELMGPGGQPLLWRGGSLEVNPDGYLAAANGMALKANITVPTGASAISIGADGKVMALVAGETNAVQIGQIDLVVPKDMTQVTAMSDGLYQVSDETDLQTLGPGQDGAGILSAGMLEGSNVQLSDELTTMLLLQRAYGANAEVVQAGDQLMSIANNLKR